MSCLLKKVPKSKDLMVLVNYNMDFLVDTLATTGKTELILMYFLTLNKLFFFSIKSLTALITFTGILYHANKQYYFLLLILIRNYNFALTKAFHYYYQIHT